MNTFLGWSDTNRGYLSPVPYFILLFFSLIVLFFELGEFYEVICQHFNHTMDVLIFVVLPII